MTGSDLPCITPLASWTVMMDVPPPLCLTPWLGLILLLFPLCCYFVGTTHAVSLGLPLVCGP